MVKIKAIVRSICNLMKPCDHVWQPTGEDDKTHYIFVFESGFVPYKTTTPELCEMCLKRRNRRVF